MPAYIYDYETIQTALDLEDTLLYTNPNATFTVKQTNIIRDAINNTVDTDCDLWCYNIEIKDGHFYPELTVHTPYEGSYTGLAQREERALYLEEQAEGRAFDSIDEIRLYMNDGLDTQPLEEIMVNYEESQPEDIDSEGAEIEIDEHITYIKDYNQEIKDCSNPEPEYKTAAQTPTEPQTDAKTERKEIKTMNNTNKTFKQALDYALRMEEALYTNHILPEDVDLGLISQAINNTIHPMFDFIDFSIESVDLNKYGFTALIECAGGPSKRLTGCLDIIRNDYQDLALGFFDTNQLLTADNVTEVALCESLEEVEQFTASTIDEFNKRVIRSHMSLALIQDVQEIVLCPTYDSPERFAVILKDSAKPFKGHKSFIFNDLYELDRYLSTPEESNELLYADEIADACKIQDKLDSDIDIYAHEEYDLLNVINNTAHPDPDITFCDLEIEDGYICAKYGQEYQVFETIDEARNFLGEHSDTWKPEIVKPEEIFRKIGWEDEYDLITWTGLTLEDYNRQLVMSFIPIKALNLIKSIDFRNFEIILIMKNRHILTFETLEECKEFFQNAHDLGTLDLLENSMETFMDSLERERAALKTAEREISEERKIQKKALSKIDESKELKGAIQKLDKVKDSLKRLGKDSESTVQEIKEIFKK